MADIQSEQPMMSPFRSMILRIAVATVGLALPVSCVSAADTEPAAISARDLAACLSAHSGGHDALSVRFNVDTLRLSRYFVKIKKYW